MFGVHTGKKKEREKERFGKKEENSAQSDLHQLRDERERAESPRDGVATDDGRAEDASPQPTVAREFPRLAATAVYRGRLSLILPNMAKKVLQQHEANMQNMPPDNKLTSVEDCT